LAKSDESPHQEFEIEALYHLAPVGLCLLDRELRYRRINKRLAEMNGHPAEAHIGRTVREMIPRVAEQAEPLLLEVIRTGEPRLGVELVGETDASPGIVHTWNEHWWPVRDETAKVVGVHIAVEDITDRKRLEDELQHANRIKDEFLAILSHELRAPLNTILGWTQLLARAEDPATVRRAAEAIQRAARMQQTLVGDLLDVSAIVAGKMRLDRRPVSVSQALRGAVDSVRASAEAKHIELRVEIDADATVLGDLNRLQQIFWNLLSNAVKFTPRDGRVTAVVHRRDGECEVQVSDTGRGIAPEFLPSVFDRFRQHSPGAQGGLGLGLAIVQHLTERHGGRVSADSAGEGRGAAFTVRLPAVADRPPDG
jgi:PAS domain S-box-containing protein